MDHLTEHQRGYHGEPIPKRKNSNDVSSRHAKQFIDCPRPRCTRKGENGFIQEDQLKEHLRGYHGDHIPKRQNPTESMLYGVEHARAQVRQSTDKHSKTANQQTEQQQNHSDRPSPPERRLSTPNDLVEEIREAKKDANPLLQTTQLTPVSELLHNEILTARAFSANLGMQGYLNADNPTADKDTILDLIHTKEQLNIAMSNYQRALQQARKAEGAMSLLQTQTRSIPDDHENNEDQKGMEGEMSPVEEHYSKIKRDTEFEYPTRPHYGPVFARVAGSRQVEDAEQASNLQFKPKQQLAARDKAYTDTLSLSSLNSKSVRSSVFSVETMESATSYDSSIPWESACEELLSLLANDLKLQPLFAAASKKSLLDSDEFEDRLRKLLKIFARDLRDEAAIPIHFEAMYFVSRTARQISYAITKFYFNSQNVEDPALHIDLQRTQSPEPAKRALLSNWLAQYDPPERKGGARQDSKFKTGEDHLKNEAFGEEMPDLQQNQEDDEVESVDEPLEDEPANISTLTKTIEFLFQSRAFEKLCHDMDRFVSWAIIDWQTIDALWKNELNSVAPRALQTARPHQVQTSHEEKAGVIDTLKIALENFSGESWNWWPLQPPRQDLRPGKVRLTWTCVKLHQLTC